MDCGLVLGAHFDWTSPFPKENPLFPTGPATAAKIPLQTIHDPNKYLRKVLGQLQGHGPVIRDEKVVWEITAVTMFGQVPPGAVRGGYTHLEKVLKELRMLHYRPSIFWLMKHHIGTPVLSLTSEMEKHVICRFRELYESFLRTFSNKKVIDELRYRRGTMIPRRLKRVAYSNSSTGRHNLPPYRFLVWKILREQAWDTQASYVPHYKGTNKKAEQCWDIIANNTHLTKDEHDRRALQDMWRNLDIEIFAVANTRRSKSKSKSSGNS